MITLQKLNIKVKQLDNNAYRTASKKNWLLKIAKDLKLEIDNINSYKRKKKISERKYRPINIDEFIADMRTIAVDGKLLREDYAKRGKFSYRAARIKFNKNWTELARIAGFSVTDGPTARVTESEMWNDLLKVMLMADTGNEKISNEKQLIRYYKKYGKYSTTIFNKQFKGWRNVFNKLHGIKATALKDLREGLVFYNKWNEFLITLSAMPKFVERRGDNYVWKNGISSLGDFLATLKKNYFFDFPPKAKMQVCRNFLRFFGLSDKETLKTINGRANLLGICVSKSKNTAIFQSVIDKGTKTKHK